MNTIIQTYLVTLAVRTLDLTVTPSIKYNIYTYCAKCTI